MTMQKPSWPQHAEDEINAVSAVLLSGRTNYWTGTKCREFEKEYAAYVGTAYAVALMNGTVALEAALYALDIGPGDEVITSCRTFIASASCIVMRGATPVLVDVDLESQNMTAASIEPLITSRTKAIVVVHLAGWPADMEAILKLAKQHNLKVIEDCAQAHGATINGKQIGGWGDIAAFSFCQDKIITTGGEGGMVTTNDKRIWEKVWSFKDHGKNYDKIYHHEHPPGFRWLHDSFGTNWRMTEIQATIGSLQLRKLPEWLRLRRQHADILTRELGEIAALKIPLPPANLAHAYYKYYVFVRPEMLKNDWNRDRIMQEVNALGVLCYVGSCSDIFFEKAFNSENNNLNLAKLNKPKPNAKLLGETSLMFLVDPALTDADMYKTVEIVKKVMTMATSNKEQG